MPQIMPIIELTPEQEEGRERLMKAVFPEYSSQNLAAQLKLNGLSINALASIYAESLNSVNPETKLVAIEKLLKLLGVDANIETNKEAVRKMPVVNIQFNSGQQNNLLQMIAPTRQLASSRSINEDEEE